MAGRLQDKVCVITGAGSGMGKAMAEIFTREGAKLVLADISGNQDAVAKAVGNGAIGVHCDVSNEDDVQAMIAAAEKEFGRLDAFAEETARASAQSLGDQFVLFERGEDEDLDAREVLILGDHVGCRNAIDVRHADVHQDDVGAMGTR